MKHLLIMLLMAAAAGCPFPAPKGDGGRDTGRSLSNVERMVREGDYQQARDEYLRIAKLAPGSPEGEEASYRAARILMASRNPGRNYAAAVTELEDHLRRYPKGGRADDAADLIAALDLSQQARVHVLLESINAYEKKVTALTNERREAAAEQERTLKERDALRTEREALTERLAALIEERDDLLQKRSALLHDRSVLAKENSSLKKRVEAMKKENEKLLAAKEKLEKNLRDITAIDVKMEKERKKMK